MAAAYVVLAPNTPPDSAKPLAIFIVNESAGQGDSTALARAEEFKDDNSPTSPDPQACDVSVYNTDVVINP